jgi:hypothetical protein
MLPDFIPSIFNVAEIRSIYLGFHLRVTSLAGLLSQGSLAKGVLGSVQAYSEEGGNAQL